MKIYCILSDERAYRSRSPAMFTAVLKRMGINGAYVPFKVAPQHIGQALQSLRILNIAGANVTVPYKESVIPHLDVLSEGANVIGAINTIVRNGKELKGYNTNAIGFMDALNSIDFDPEGKSALIFGSGGAAKAVAFIFNWLRTKAIYVTGRNPVKIESLVNRFGGTAIPLSELVLRIPKVDIIVNATSVSSAIESSELADLLERLEPVGCEMIMDLNYDRPENIWERLARRKKIRFIDGFLPLAYQARRTFALWTGMQVPPEEFLKAVDR